MEIGTVKLIDIDHEMRGAYLDYAMSVITARALPDVRDGLKPVQRRILYAMNELNLSHTSAYKKSARIVGEVLGKYHPHGDAPVYETMVRMAQDFSMRYVLVDGQGNFGSVDGDPPAAMRYTEARLAAVAEELLADLDKNTVDFGDNFDGTLKEPTVLPARLPNLLVNGSAGIAVGMATNIPPHNLTEVADAIIYILDQFQRAVDGGIPFDLAQARVHSRPIDRETVLALRKGLSAEFKTLLAQAVEQKASELEKPPKTKEQKDDLEHDALLDVIDDTVDVPVERLSQMVLGPDFPTGGIIIGRKGITDAFTTGHGRIVIRAKAHVEERSGDRSTIIVTELPYQINKATLVERIADLMRDKRIEGISDLRDESDRHGMRVVIELRRDVAAKQILNNLFKLTAMQSAFSVNLLALVDGEPRVLNLKRLLQHYVDFRYQVITRRIQFELDKARARAHILEGLKIALDNLDEVISTIRNSPDADVARTRLIKRFKLSEIQAQAILDMQLRRLAALERKKIEQELADLLKTIAGLEDLLAHPIKIYGLIKQDLIDLKQKFGDERRTKIRDEEAEDFTAEDLIPDEDIMVAISARSYIKRVPADQFRAQVRRTPARSVTTVISKEQDPVVLLASANTHDTIIFLSNVGKAYAMKAHEIPAGDRQARGVPLGNFLSTAMTDERIVGIATAREQNGDSVTFITQQGELKRVLISDLSAARASGLNAVALAPKDEVVWAAPTAAGDEIILATARGQAIRFEPEKEARASGRGSGGVRGIRLDEGDQVVAVDIVDKDAALMTVTSLGFVKQTGLAEYSPQGRGGGGIVTAGISEKNGPLAAARVVSPGDDVIFVSAQGQFIRRPAEDAPVQARSGRGVRLVELEKGDYPIAVLRLRPEKKPSDDVSPDGNEPPTPKPARKKAAPEASAQSPLTDVKTPNLLPVDAGPAPSPKRGEGRSAAAESTMPPATPRRSAAKAEGQSATATPPAATAKREEGRGERRSAPSEPTTSSRAAGKAEDQSAPAVEPSVVPPPSPLRSARLPSGPTPAADSKSKTKPAVSLAPQGVSKTPAKTADSATAASQPAAPAPHRSEAQPTPPAPTDTALPHFVRKSEAAKQAAPPTEPAPPAKGAPKRLGKDEIVIHSGGKTTVVPRTDLESAKAKDPKEAPKSEKQIPLPLWSDEPAKKK